MEHHHVSARLKGPSPPNPHPQVNQMLPIGGPGPAYTAKAQADLLFKLSGQTPKYFPVPVALMDGIIGMLDFFAKFFPDKFEVRGEGLLLVTAGGHSTAV